MASACSEVIWLRALLTRFGVLSISATPLYADNQSAIKIATNPVFHERTKHIEVDCHFIREKYLRKLITLPYVSSQNQLADLLTKPMTSPRQNFLLSKLLRKPP